MPCQIGRLGTELTRDFVADWKTKREWHHYALEQMEAAGYTMSSPYTLVRQHEPGKFVYRDTGWRGSDMLGTGVASFSHISGVHFQNAASWDEYVDSFHADKLRLDSAFLTTPEERLIREMILQLTKNHFRGKSPSFRRGSFKTLDLISMETYGILVLSFGGKVSRHRSVVLPTPFDTGYERRKDNPMKTFKFKLYSNHGNRELHQAIDGHAEVWNHCVAPQRRYYAIYGKYISRFWLINHISKLKQTKRCPLESTTQSGDSRRSSPP